MIKLGFKIFALLTVIFFVGTASIYMAVTAIVPAAHVQQRVFDTVYPLAMENSKIKFDSLFKNLSNGTLRQQFVFTELEANAFVYNYLGKRQDYPIKEPYVSFIPDAVRLRFDVAAPDTMKLIANQMNKVPFAQSLKEVSGENNTGRRVSFTIDVGMNWEQDRPVLSVERVYIGVLPLPFKSFFNSFLVNVNDRLAATFSKTIGKSPLYVREFKVADKQFLCTLESKVDDAFVRRAENDRLQKNNPDIFTAFGRNRNTCRIACTPEEEERLKKLVGALATKNNLSEDDLNAAGKMMSEVEKK